MNTPWNTPAELRLALLLDLLDRWEIHCDETPVSGGRFRWDENAREALHAAGPDAPDAVSVERLLAMACEYLTRFPSDRGSAA